MKEILLTQGQVTQVSDERYTLLISMGRWYAKWNSHTKSYYAARTDSSGKTVRMHNVILGIPKGGEHIDCNTLNNQDDNLRPDLEGRNPQNRKIQGNNTSGYKGVYWNKIKRKWVSQIKFQYKNYHLGYFNIAEDAARAYNKAALELHGEFARLNVI
jgi:hypothetical protein